MISCGPWTRFSSFVGLSVLSSALAHTMMHFCNCTLLRRLVSTQQSHRLSPNDFALWLVPCCRLLDAAAWAAARWARTYLMPGEAVSRAMHDAFGCSAGGAETAETLVKLVGACSRNSHASTSGLHAT